MSVRSKSSAGDAEDLGLAAGVGQRRLGALLHHFAQLAGEGQ